MDRATAKKLFERHHLPLYRTLRRLSGDAALAEDLVQEVFLRALDARAAYEERGQERAWLFTIARRLLADRRRASRRRPAAAPLDEVDRSCGRDGAGDLRAALEQALARLPERDREIFLLRENGGLGHEEIARVVGATPAAVRNRLHHARLTLREHLRPELNRARRPRTPEPQR
jgi:RNA polymerase sigma-70 factor (ECF subfamily)